MKSALRLTQLMAERTIGKKVGHNTYVHKSAEKALPASLSKAKSAIGNFEYTIVKHNAKTGDFTFINSPDFDTAPEPKVGKAILVKPDGSTKEMAPKADPQIYHHKHLFVDPSYKGFDVKASQDRSKKWMALPDVDRSRIGTQSYWNKNVLPRIN